MADDVTYWRCPDCDGKGRKWPTGIRCSKCGGTGNALATDGERAVRKITMPLYPIPRLPHELPTDDL